MPVEQQVSRQTSPVRHPWPVSLSHGSDWKHAYAMAQTRFPPLPARIQQPQTLLSGAASGWPEKQQYQSQHVEQGCSLSQGSSLRSQL
jgi:hypothetical protein